MNLKNRKGFSRVLFSLDIDFNYSAKKIYGPLEIGRRYIFPQANNLNSYEQPIYYSDILDSVKRVINDDLKSECQKYINLSIDQIEIIKIYQGSIHILFSVVFNTLGVISQLKDLYDCIEIIKAISKAHLQNRLQTYYGNWFDTSITVIGRGNRKSYDCFCEHETLQPIKYRTRDYFFYYLLISNIILVVSLILLTYKAVLKMYW